MKSIIIVAIIFLGCIALNEGTIISFCSCIIKQIRILFLALQCYSHTFCGTNCPQLSDAVETCQGDQNKCYKAAVPGGVKRGCANKQCNVEVSSSLSR
jgi:hypothetical protein